ncbi:MAG TPA: hypothetical protein VG106_04310 [Vicinamibacterales bacterium]|nr:hypothetical protein [Vicinamibacterales bacterium]
MHRLLALIVTVATTAAAQNAQLPSGYWAESKSATILEKTQTIRLAPDLQGLSDGERAAVDELQRVGEIMQALYEESRHPDALEAKRTLIELDRRLGSPVATQNLLTLYRLFQGPIASTLDNRREAFLPVRPQTPARSVYPPDITRAEVDAFLEAHPEERSEILGERTVVRRATKENLAQDLRVLENGALATLHAHLRSDLQQLAAKPDGRTLYAVPYAVAYADELTRAFHHLMTAARLVEPSDAEFARYLRNRARDFLSNDYESGDASWVTGRFRRLNAQIGAYETYDDALFGVKAFHSLSLLLQDEQATADLRRRLGGLQEIENALPFERHKRVNEDISVGVYSIIADFGQARGTNSATILPNDPLFSSRYGRTILLRQNILTHPDLFAADVRTWRAVVADTHHADLTSEGSVQRVLWHEVGHYLGPDRDKQGRTLDVALEEHADAMEEMKADLVSLFALQTMHRAGTIDAAALRAARASGIRRVLLNVQPRRDQPYQTMQLAQFNYFLHNKLLTFDASSSRLTIHYDRYETVVASLLRDVLSLQYHGNREAAGAFFDRWGAWTADLHETLAARMREAQGARYRLVRYAVLGE